MSSSISPIFTCFARGSLLGGWRIGQASPVSIRWYTLVGPSIVITLHSKDSVSSSSNSWNSASLRCGLAAVIMCCNIRTVSWTCGCSTLGGATSMTASQCARGSFCELLVEMDSIQDPHMYLPAVSDQCPGYVVLWEHGPLDSVLPGYFPLQGGSPIQPSQFPRIVQISSNHWQLPGWKARAQPWGSTAIPLPLQDAAFSILGPQMHCMHAGCPVP
jgi:hypothetical protein